MLLNSFFFLYTEDIKYSYQIQVIWTKLYAFKYSYQIQIIILFTNDPSLINIIYLHTIIWFQVIYNIVNNYCF